MTVNRIPQSHYEWPKPGIAPLSPLVTAVLGSAVRPIQRWWQEQHSERPALSTPQSVDGADAAMLADLHSRVATQMQRVRLAHPSATQTIQLTVPPHATVGALGLHTRTVNALSAIGVTHDLAPLATIPLGTLFKHCGARTLLDLLSALDALQGSALQNPPKAFAPVPVDEGIYALAAFPAADKITRDDARFGAIVRELDANASTLLEATVMTIQRWDERTVASDFAPAHERMVQCLSMDVAQELDSFITAATRTPDAAAMLMERLVYSGGERPTLQSIGEKRILTKERVRQIERDAFTQIAAGEPWAPRARALQDAISHSQPLSPEKYDQIVRSFWTSREQPSPESLRDILECLLPDTQGTWAVSERCSGKLLEPTANAEQLENAAHVMLQLVDGLGISTRQSVFDAVVGAGITLDTDNLESLVNGRRLMWLGANREWIGCCRDGVPVGKIAGVCRKMFSVSPRLSIAQLHNGYNRHSTRKLDRITPEMIGVVAKALPGCTRHGDSFHVPGMNCSQELEAFELALVELLSTPGGQMVRKDLAAALLAKGFNPTTINCNLSWSAILVSLRHGLRGLVGHGPLEVTQLE